MTTSADPHDLATTWARDGYVVVRQLLPATMTDSLCQIAEASLTQWRECNPETGEPGGDGQATTMRHLNHPDYHRGNPTSQIALLGACAHRNILDVASSLLDGAPLFRCTSLFFNPLEDSRDGHWHRDSQFHCPIEKEEKQMITAGGGTGWGIQLQIALAPSDDVEVVPGSHTRWDTSAEYEIRLAHGKENCQRNDMPGAVRVDLKPGDAVAFNPMGLHRGRYHTDRLRRTLMLTYTHVDHPRFDYFSDQPWFDEKGYLDGLPPCDASFFARFVEAYGHQWRQKERQ